MQVENCVIDSADFSGLSGVESKELSLDSSSSRTLVVSKTTILKSVEGVVVSKYGQTVKKRNFHENMNHCPSRVSIISPSRLWC